MHITELPESAISPSKSAKVERYEQEQQYFLTMLESSDKQELEHFKQSLQLDLNEIKGKIDGVDISFVELDIDFFALEIKRHDNRRYELVLERAVNVRTRFLELLDAEAGALDLEARRRSFNYDDGGSNFAKAARERKNDELFQQVYSLVRTGDAKAIEEFRKTLQFDITEIKRKLDGRQVAAADLDEDYARLELRRNKLKRYQLSLHRAIATRNRQIQMIVDRMAAIKREEKQRRIELQRLHDSLADVQKRQIFTDLLKADLGSQYVVDLKERAAKIYEVMNGIASDPSQ